MRESYCFIKVMAFGNFSHKNNRDKRNATFFFYQQFWKLRQIINAKSFVLFFFVWAQRDVCIYCNIQLKHTYNE